MKILSLKIQNFETFGPEGISVSINQLSALIGVNNTGKSNVLEALDRLEEEDLVVERNPELISSAICAPRSKA